MADQYDILGFDMYEISGPQSWPRQHGMTSDDKVAGMPVYMRSAHSSGAPGLVDPRPIGITGPLGAWQRSRGINRYDILGKHGGGYHHGGGRGYSYPVAYYPADTYDIVYNPIDVMPCKGIRLKDGRCITSDEILSGFMRGQDFISAKRVVSICNPNRVGGPIAVPPATRNKRNMLKPGDVLNRNEELVTSNGGRLLMQPAGNLVLYGPGGPNGTYTALWWSTDHATPATQARVEADGTLRVVDAKGKEYYKGVPRSKAVKIVFQTDGNLVWYDANGRPVLDSGTSGWHINAALAPHSKGFFGSIAHDIGSAVHTVTHAAAAVYNAVDNVASKIPILGTPLHAALGMTVGNITHTVDAIAHGANIKRAALSSMKDELTNANTLGQYASVITSAIPGIGTTVGGITAALAAAHAISEGKPVTDALIGAVKDAAIRAIPGGTLVQKAASEAFEVGKSLAHGERIDHIALDRARAQVPANLRPVFDAGLAVAQGKKVQDAIVKGVAAMGNAQLSKLAGDGAKLLQYSTPLRMAALAVGGDARKGFQTATALLAHTGVPESAVTALRNKLTPAQRTGFDKAVAEHAKIFNSFRRV